MSIPCKHFRLNCSLIQKDVANICLVSLGRQICLIALLASYVTHKLRKSFVILFKGISLKCSWIMKNKGGLFVPVATFTNGWSNGRQTNKK